MKRRSFLHLAAGGAAEVLSRCNAVTQPQPVSTATGPDALQIIRNAAFNDWRGNTFNPDIYLKGKPFLILFGFADCNNFCPDISSTAGAAHQYLMKNGVEVPVVVISVSPEYDSVDPSVLMRRYVNAGIPTSTGDKRQPLLHPLFARTTEEARNVHTELGSMLNPDDPNYHTSLLMLVAPNGRIAARYDTNLQDPQRITELSETLLDDIRREIAAAVSTGQGR